MRERSTALQQTTESETHHNSGSNSGSSGSAALSSNSWLYGKSNKNSYPAVSRLSSASATEVQCSVENVYPLPELTIYQVLKDGASPRSLQNARLSNNITQMPNGAFRVTQTAFVEDAELLKNSFPQNSSPLKYHPNTVLRKPSSNRNPNGFDNHEQGAIFECLVSQEEIDHDVRKRTTFLPLKGIFHYLFLLINIKIHFNFDFPIPTDENDYNSGAIRISFSMNILNLFIFCLLAVHIS